MCQYVAQDGVLPASYKNRVLLTRSAPPAHPVTADYKQKALTQMTRASLRINGRPYTVSQGPHSSTPANQNACDNVQQRSECSLSNEIAS